METNKELQIVKKIQETIQVEKQRRIESTDALENGMKEIEEILRNCMKTNEQMKRTNQELVNKLKVLDTEKKQLENEKKHFEKEIRRHTKQLESTDKEKKRMLEKNIIIIQRLADKEADFDRIKDFNAGLQHELTKANSMIEQYKLKCQEFYNNWQSCIQMVQQSDQRIQRLQSTLEQHQHSTDNLESSKTKKEDLLTRPDETAVPEHSQGNTAISYLSDEDRPMKIAEKYSELYDNEWTDALEELLDNGADDNRGIAILLEIITGAYKFCGETAEKYQEGMTQSAICLPDQPLGSPPSLVSESFDLQRLQQSGGDVQASVAKTVQLTEEQKKILADLRRALSPKFLHVVEERYMSILDELLLKEFGKLKQIAIPCDHSRNEAAKTSPQEKNNTEAVVFDSSFEIIKSFAKKCATLCWFMRIKDPPLYMMHEVSYGCPMDTESFKHYTQSGKTVKFLVWPALFLHKGGALLAKGVAQPMKRAEEREFTKKNSASVY